MNFSKQDKKDESKAEIKENVNEETKDENKDAVTEEVKEEVEPPSQEEPPSILRTIRNVIIGLVVLTILVIGGFAAAVKFNVLKAEDVAILYTADNDQHRFNAKRVVQLFQLCVKASYCLV